MSLTTQSESVPLGEATRRATGRPRIFTGVVRTSDTKATTSGRPEASRWSVTSHSLQLWPLSILFGTIGRAWKGTGLAGSETYSSYAPSLGFGGSYRSFR